MTYDHRLTPTFSDCVERYRTRQDILAALFQTLAELAIQPFGNPRLQTHEVKRAQPNTYTCRVTNKGHRLIWRRVGNVIVLLLFGEHDAVYRRAERLRLEIDDSQNVLRVIDEDPESRRPVPYLERRSDEGRLFMAWNDSELAGFGFAGDEIRLLRRLDSDDDLMSLDDRMRAESWQTAMNLAMYGHPDGEVASFEPDEVEQVAPAAGEDSHADSRIAEVLRDRDASPEFVPVAADELAAVLARPIEDWMVYLDPAQRSLVERHYSGPGRIRGAAGTGKTVVALHRARVLADSGKRILFTTYVRNLPAVYKQLFARLSPTGLERVEFANVHRWALGYLHRNGVHLRLDLKAADQAWKAAYRDVAVPGSPLGKSKLTQNYLQEEVEWVIRGRDLPDLDAYLSLERNGRGTPLSSTLRREVWRLSERYAEELRTRGACDFTDVLIQARDVARQAEEPEFDAVIIDEAQDLTEAALRLLHALVGDRHNGLLLVGDGQQSIYPGGFNLTTLGIRVAGRSHVLTRNYRNTREIYAAAQSVVEQHDFDDGGETLESGHRGVEVVRRGPAPAVVVEENEEAHDLALAAAVEAALGHGTGPGDLAILVPTRAMAKHFADLVTGLGLPAQHLEEYDGTPNPLVKVGTYRRAKGLEFKQVFLPRLDPDGLRESRRASEDDQMYAERLDLLRRQLFVAMSRARDALWLGYVGAPSASLPRSLWGTSESRTPAE